MTRNDRLRVDRAIDDQIKNDRLRCIWFSEKHLFIRKLALCFLV